ncbi:MAG: ATP-binding cassette domain-containing protein [Deltaproteobacteria bacterium]|nr:ATP-binding cassette domain-containing protein [Deltaproteobacteria bacterium]
MTFAAETRNVRKVLSGTPVLDGCDLALEAGRLHGLVGAGSSGKTLVLKTLATLLPPDSGDVVLFGEAADFGDVGRLRTVRARIGMQFQNVALFDFLDVAGNVAFPLVNGDVPVPPGEVASRVESALAAVGLAGAGGLAPHELSGGMQRRVAIARAAVTRAALMVFDDPTGGLDPVTSSRIFGLIADVQAASGSTVVLASHDTDRLARVCHLFHVVDRGRIAFTGTLPDGLAHADPAVRRLLGGDA